MPSIEHSAAHTFLTNLISNSIARNTRIQQCEGGRGRNRAIAQPGGTHGNIAGRDETKVPQRRQRRQGGAVGVRGGATARALENSGGG